MKALSIRQPWAWLIVHGFKPVENRSWPTKHRGAILIHAGLVWDGEGLASVLATFPELRHQLPLQFDLGGIVGRAHLCDCVQQHPSPWFTGPYGFVLAEPQPLPFVRMPGQLSFFEVELSERIDAALRSADASAPTAGQAGLF